MLAATDMEVSLRASVSGCKAKAVSPCARTASAPNELLVADIERHEALLDRAVVKGHRLRLVAAGR